jgi:hypothetical protein
MTEVLYTPRLPEFISGSRNRRMVFLLRDPGLHRDDDRIKNNLSLVIYFRISQEKDYYYIRLLDINNGQRRLHIYSD